MTSTLHGPIEGGSAIDRFVNGPSASAGGTLPVLGPFGPSLAETYGFGGTGTEVGVGVGGNAA